MKAISLLTLREKRGAPHIWVESFAVSRAGFEPGLRFTVDVFPGGLVLRVAEDGDRLVHAKNVPLKRGGQSVRPVIEINSKSDMAPLVGHGSARVVYGDRMITISPLASEVRRVRRLRRLHEHLADGELHTAGIATGGGIATHALHAGINDAGLHAEALLNNEIRVDLTEHAAVHNDALSTDTVIANLPLQELAFDDEVARRLPEVDVLELGLPCSGASVAGRSKNKIALPEDHPVVGALIAPAIAMIAKLNPVSLLLENVPAYANSASASILRGYLRDMGYDVHERVLLATDFGELEARKRWYLVGMTTGIAFDFDAIETGEFAPRCLAEAMDDVALNDPTWSRMQYLVDKQERDEDAGKGFRLQIYNGSEHSINTLTKGLAKRRSTDPMFCHPKDPSLLRLPTVGEHCRFKGIPEHLAANLSKTIAHQMLGQSIAYRVVRAIGKLITQSLVAHNVATIRPLRKTYATVG